MGEDGLDLPIDRKTQQASSIVGYPDRAIPVDGKTVRPAVVLRDDGPLQLRRDAENAAERDVDHIKVAFTIERRAFQEAVDLGPRLVRIAPLRAPAPAKG